MIKRRNMPDETMTFGTGVPRDVLGTDIPPYMQYRALPSQFYTMAHPIGCEFIRNTFQNQKDDHEKTADS